MDYCYDVPVIVKFREILDNASVLIEPARTFYSLNDSKLERKTSLDPNDTFFNALAVF